MAHSLMLGGANAGMHVRVSSPAGFDPDPAILLDAKTRAADTGGVDRARSPTRTRRSTGADVVVTDTWTSMGQEDDGLDRVGAVPAVPGERASCSAAPTPTRSCCTACPRTAAGRSPTR